MYVASSFFDVFPDWILMKIQSAIFAMYFVLRER